MKGLRSIKIVLLFVLLSTKCLFGQTDYLVGDEIQENATITIENDLFGVFNPSLWNKDVYTLVSLKYNQLDIPFNTVDGLSLDVPFTLVGYTRENDIAGTETGILTLNYDELSVEGTDHVAIKIDKNYYKVELTVGSIKSSHKPLLTESILLETSIHYDRVVIPSAINQVNPPTSVFDLLTNELEILWDYNGAKEYELEMLFVSAQTIEYDNLASNINITSNRPDESQADRILRVEQLFRYNATRIVTNKNHFKYTLAYGLGKVYYRYRGIGTSLDGEKITGQWSQVNESTSFLIDNFILNENNNNNSDLSWVYSANYSNDGKLSESKTFVSPDGKARQSIVKDVLNGNVVVGEQKYDFNGAPTISILPGVHQGSNLKYQPNYTLDNSGNPYGKLNFATDDKVSESGTGPDPINPVADAQTSNGTQYHNNYFSKNNPFNGDGLHDYVADAEGYPFSMAWIDNEGRLTKAGGLGIILGDSPQLEKRLKHLF